MKKAVEKAGSQRKLAMQCGVSNEVISDILGGSWRKMNLKVLSYLGYREVSMFEKIGGGK